MSFLPNDNHLIDKLAFYILFILITFSALVLFSLLGISLPVSVTTSARSTELAVVGEGKAEVVPDTAFVDAGITVNNAATAEAAQAKIDNVNNKIISSMKALGISQNDIKTSNYSISPAYDFKSGGNEITGYSGNATVEIKIKNLKLASSVISEVTKAGANQISGTRFTIDNPQVYREMARDRAIANAKEQAAKLAGSLGIRLGRVVNIVESSPNIVYPMMRADAAVGLGGGGPELSPGTQTVASTVTLYFEKK